MLMLMLMLMLMFAPPGKRGGKGNRGDPGRPHPGQPGIPGLPGQYNQPHKQRRSNMPFVFPFTAAPVSESLHHGTALSYFTVLTLMR